MKGIILDEHKDCFNLNNSDSMNYDGNYYNNYVDSDESFFNVGGKLSTGAKAGIAAGALGGILLINRALKKSKQRRKDKNQQQENINLTTPPTTANTGENNNNNNDEKGTNVWLWVRIGGGVLVLGIVTFIIIKNKNKSI
jgi:hypothetical protein